MNEKMTVRELMGGYYVHMQFILFAFSLDFVSLAGWASIERKLVLLVQAVGLEIY
jgi:hypothetical protein